MTADDETRGRQLRCQRHMLELRMLASVEGGPTAAEVGRTTAAVLAEVGAASRAVLATGHSRRHPGATPFLQARLNRLTVAADEAIAAARDGDSAALRCVLHRFEVLTSAIWTVHDAVRGPAVGHGMASCWSAETRRRRQEDAGAVDIAVMAGPGTKSPLASSRAGAPRPCAAARWLNRTAGGSLTKNGPGSTCACEVGK
jgi:hypothetical protein